MKRKTYLQIVFILISFISMGQEICDNGIDDDNDGLIDLNDQVDCVCNTFTATTDVTSLIQNPSFEDTIYCPNNSGQLDAVVGWVQAGAPGTTTDYMNTCGVIFESVKDAGLVPFPDGNGIVGIMISNQYVEYVGTCLLSPMIAGTQYTLQFNLANVTMHDGTKVAPDGSYGGAGTTFTYPWPPFDTYGSYGAIDMTIYGTTSCGNLPISSDGCPTEDSTPWMKLGSINYTPNSSWSLENIVFTPTENITAIMIGPPCEIPSDFPVTEHGDGIAPTAYFLMDNLILNETQLFDPVSITKKGSYCTNDIILTANVPTTTSQNAQIQWYKDGIALVGYTGVSYTIPAGKKGIGNYQVRLVDNGLCGLSKKLELMEEVPPTVSIEANTTIPQGGSTVMTASALATTNYLWSPTQGLSCSDCASPTATPTQTTTYCVNVLASSGCENQECVTIKVDFPCGDLFIPNSFSPNGDNNNDKLEVKINAECISDYSFMIFDRWGEKVYESTDITKSWDGKYNGKELDNAVYVYKLKMKMVNNEKYIEKTGNVSIIR